MSTSTTARPTRSSGTSGSGNRRVRSRHALGAVGRDAQSVHVEVEDGLVVCVTVIDETPVRDPTLVEGDAGYLPEAVAAADDGQPWPSWRFGY